MGYYIVSKNGENSVLEIKTSNPTKVINELAKAGFTVRTASEKLAKGMIKHIDK